MSFRRYEIILPTRYNDGTPVPEENHLWVGEQLASEFGAYTFEPQPVRGVWTHQAIRYEENNLRASLTYRTPGKMQPFSHASRKCSSSGSGKSISGSFPTKFESHRDDIPLALPWRHRASKTYGVFAHFPFVSD